MTNFVLKPWVPASWGVMTMVAFAANSILCRLALRGGEIDPASFTGIRLASGAALLFLLTSATRKGPGSGWEAGNWFSGTMLWVYAIAFSFAYLGLSAGTGALLLFGAVQATMIGVGLVRADRPRPIEWVGLLLGFSGVVWLVLPGLSAPSLASAAVMVLAGTAWGVYSLRGQKSKSDPVAATAGNFLRAAPLGIVSLLPFLSQSHPSGKGIALAVCSGALTSGLGYVVWYSVLAYLTAPRAAILQLAVPILATIGGILFLGETLTPRFVVATVLVLGGVAMALSSRVKSKEPPSNVPRKP